MVIRRGDRVVSSWIAGLMYADDICLVAKSAEELQELMDIVGGVGREYGLCFSETKSAVVRIGGSDGNHICEEWKIGERSVRMASRVKYLGVWINGGNNGGIDSVLERIEGARKVTGMCKFSAQRSGSRLLAGRESWKGMVVPKLMYGAGAINWSAYEVCELEQMQNSMGRFLWGVGQGVGNGFIRGETGYSSFEEREAKQKLDSSGESLRGVTH